MCMKDKLQAVPPPSVSASELVSQAQKDSSWQDKYARSDWQKELTKLTPEEEQKFQAWATGNKVPITADYDMRGFWKDGGESGINRNDGMMHYSDKYKTPLHESFSGESKYARTDIPTPRWNDQDQLVAPNGSVLFDEPAVVAARRAKGGQ